MHLDGNFMIYKNASGVEDLKRIANRDMEISWNYS